MFASEITDILDRTGVIGPDLYYPLIVQAIVLIFGEDAIILAVLKRIIFFDCIVLEGRCLI